jgi:hypothetical protein
MKRVCDGTDPNLVTRDGAPCSCGLRFDDVDRMVVFPHPTIVPTVERQRVLERLAEAELRRRLN